MNDLIEAMKSWPWAVIGGPAITGLFAFIALAYKNRADKLLAREQRRDDLDRRDKEDDEKARIADHGFDIAQSQDLTMRFKALMDGYESRIRDLTAEQAAWRIERATLQADLRVLNDQYRDLLMKWNNRAAT